MREINRPSLRSAWLWAPAIALPLLLSGCGSSGTASSGPEEPTTSSSSAADSESPTSETADAAAASSSSHPANGALPDACSLATRQQIQGVTGRDPGAPKSGQQGSGEHTYSFCTYPKSPVLWVGPAADYAATKGYGEKHDPVDGVGSDAYWDFREGTGVYVMVARGEAYFVAINYESPDKATALDQGSRILSTMLGSLS